MTRKPSLKDHAENRRRSKLGLRKRPRRPLSRDPKDELREGPRGSAKGEPREEREVDRRWRELLDRARSRPREAALLTHLRAGSDHTRDSLMRTLASATRARPLADVEHPKLEARLRKLIAKLDPGEQKRLAKLGADELEKGKPKGRAPKLKLPRDPRAARPPRNPPRVRPAAQLKKSASHLLPLIPSASASSTLESSSIQPLPPPITSQQWLEDVQEVLREHQNAALAIAAKYESLGNDQKMMGDPQGSLENLDGRWFLQRYTRGLIYHHAPRRTPALYTVGNDYLRSVAKAYMEGGAHEGPLGLPWASVRPTTVGDGEICAFNNGIACRVPRGDTKILDNWDIAGRWIAEGREAGRLGFPGYSVRETTTAAGTPGYYAKFEHGRIFTSEQTGTHIVEDLIAREYIRQRSKFGFPTTDMQWMHLRIWQVTHFETGAVFVTGVGGREFRSLYGPLYAAWRNLDLSPAVGPMKYAPTPVERVVGWDTTKTWELALLHRDDQTLVMHRRSFDRWQHLVGSSLQNEIGHPTHSEVQNPSEGYSIARCTHGVILRRDQDAVWMPQAMYAMWTAGGHHPWPKLARELTVKGERALEVRLGDDEALLSSDHGLVWLEGPWLAAWRAHDHDLGLPTGPVANSPYQATGGWTPGLHLPCVDGVLWQNPLTPTQIHFVERALFDEWIRHGGISGPLGPITGSSLDLRRRPTPAANSVEVGRKLRCYYGTVYAWQGGPSHALWGAAEDCYRRADEADGILGELRGSGGTTDRVHCQHGWIIPGLFGVFAMPDTIYDRWQAEGGVDKLGLPAEDATLLERREAAVTRVQRFQGGRIVHYADGSVRTLGLTAKVELIVSNVHARDRTSDPGKSDEMAMVVTAIGAGGHKGKNSIDLGRYRHNEYDGTDRLLFAYAMHRGVGWPKAYAALVAPVERDHGGLNAIGQELFDAAEEVLTDYLGDAFGSFAEAVSGGIPIVRWLVDEGLDLLFESIVGAIFEAIVEGINDDVFKPQMITFSLLDGANGYMSPIEELTFSGHGGIYDIGFRWKVVYDD